MFFFLWWHYMDKQAILPCGFYFKIRQVLFTFTCQNNWKSMTLSQFESKLVAATAVAYSTSFQRLKWPQTKMQPTYGNTFWQSFSCSLYVVIHFVISEISKKLEVEVERAVENVQSMRKWFVILIQSTTRITDFWS